ncbi:hypothetical protein HF521_012663 [Silurus meridionalis]|uniref:Integrase catalytic domain-containing protein n=1 Tax=Silurus meridionalis TaxID=175797 RepID=A0A8T0ABE4_SILME|nr:hypothetical protein HF521_012663 [Silurus meridionalis]
MPVIIKGTESVYTPWSFMDLTGLINRLPNICEGAQRWITRFEEQTMGQMLAMGDIKAILTQSLGKAKMIKILDQAQLGDVGKDQKYDLWTFGAKRKDVWNALRSAYPTQSDLTKVENLKMNEKEELRPSFLNYRTITLFKIMLKRALPSEVQEKLESVVGLNALPWAAFQANVTHAVEMYRKKKEANKQAAEDLITLLHKAQLGEIAWSKQENQEKRKEEKSSAKQAAVMMVLTNAQQDSAGQTIPDPGNQQLMPVGQPMMAYPTNHQYPPQNRGWGQGRGRGRGMFQSRNYQPPRGGRCWNCQDSNHMMRNCPYPIRQQQGATFTSIGKEGSKLPLSRKAVKTVGFSGKTQTLHFTEPQDITVEGITIQAPLLYSPDTPANLLGRDVLCKLGAKIFCGPTGVWVELPEILAQQCVMVERKIEQQTLDKVYWLELDGTSSEIHKLYDHLKTWFTNMRPDCVETRKPWHCTMRYDEGGQDEEYETLWGEHVEGNQYSLKAENVILGPQGIAATVQLPDHIAQWYSFENSVPHVSLMIGQNFKSKDLGPMVREATMMLPKALAIVKYKAHKSDGEMVSRGNAAADEAAKSAAVEEDCVKVMVQDEEHEEVQGQVREEDLGEYQDVASGEEKERWKKRGAVQDPNTGLWRSVDGVWVAPLALLPRLIAESHGSQGLVERANGVLKEKIAKICASTDLNWVQALPLALMKMRSQTNRNTHLTPHELLTGRPMPVAFTQGPYTGSSLDQLEADMSSYCKHLTQIHRTLYSQVCEAAHGAPVDEPLQQVQPGDYVYIKVFKRKHWSEPRREGPFKVVLATPTAVKVEGKEYWYHLNHCCRAAVKEPQWRKSQAELAHCAHSDDSEDDDGAGPAQDRGPAYKTRAKTKQPQPVEGELKAGCSYEVDSRPPHDTLDSDKVEETVQRLLGNEEDTVTPPAQFGTLNLQDLVNLDIDLPVEP